MRVRRCSRRGRVRWWIRRDDREVERADLREAQDLKIVYLRQPSDAFHEDYICLLNKYHDV